MARLFISQERLDAWTADSKVDVDGSEMTLVEDGRSFAIRPAVLFLKVAGNDPDESDLLGRVKDEDALAAMGADQYMNSVIVGDVAYDVRCGFIGDPL
jgi:hypothetical protein